MKIARRIALPISSFLPNLGGAEVGLHNIALKLLDRGREPVVLAPAPHVARLRREGWNLPYEVEPLPPKIWSILYRAPPIGFFILDRYFARAQRRHNFDFWHCTFGYPTGVALVHFARNRPDVRYLIRCAGEDIQRDAQIGYGARLDPSIDRIVRHYLPHAQLLTAISDSVAEEYRALGVSDAHIRHIPNGVDLARFRVQSNRAATRALHGLDPEAFVFLCVGRNHPKKNFPTLIEAAARLAGRSDKTFQVAIAGQGAGGLHDKVQALGLAGRVHLIEQIGGNTDGAGEIKLPSPELVDLYLSADAFAFPSLMETFGIVIVEAMAAGLPIIVGDSPGCRDVIRQGRDGISVDPRNADALAGAMQRFMDDEEQRLAFGEKARARAEDFGWDRVVDSYVAVYDTAVSGAGGKQGG